MRKRERSIIISCIMIIVMVVCLFSDTMFPVNKAYAYTEKTGVVSVDADSVLNVRDGVGTSGTKVIAKLNPGAIVTIKGESNASDGSLWYKISYSGIEGYVSAKFISNVQDKIEYTEDADFEAYLNEQGFPESYKDGLRVLHSQYPKWVFVADHLQYSWEEALKGQSNGSTSLISKNAISSWKSLEKDSYNWTKGTWYTFDGGAWCAASRELVAYYMDPRNFFTDNYIWMFEKLSFQSDFQTADKLENILKGTFMEAGVNTVVNDETGAVSNYADIIMIAAQRSGVNPYHLAASILVEMGNKGTSGSISGTVAGYEGYYNYYNWGAYAHDGRTPIQNGLIYAAANGSGGDMRPWNTRFKGIVGGAVKLGASYINIGQDTLYYKKFDYIGTPYTNQYMSHIRAPEIEAKKTAKAYTTDVKQNTSIVFKIPVYKDMPNTAAPLPKGDGSPNNVLSSLTVGGYSLTPTFSTFTTEYNLVVANDVTSVDVGATAMVQGTEVTGTGTYNLGEGVNSIVITAKAENGAERKYTITIVRMNAAGDGEISNNPNPPEPPTNKTEFSTSLIKSDDTGMINGIEPGMSVEEIKTKLNVSAGTAEIQDSSGNAKAEGKICTGDKIVVKDNSGNVVYSYNAVIYGDVNGDGVISIKDLLIIRKCILGAMSLEEIYGQAGNANRDDAGVTIKDVLVLRKYILGVATISQE